MCVSGSVLVLIHVCGFRKSSRPETARVQPQFMPKPPSVHQFSTCSQQVLVSALLVSSILAPTSCEHREWSLGHVRKGCLNMDTSGMLSLFFLHLHSAQAKMIYVLSEMKSQLEKMPRLYHVCVGYD